MVEAGSAWLVTLRLLLGPVGAGISCVGIGSSSVSESESGMDFSGVEPGPALR